MTRDEPDRWLTDRCPRISDTHWIRLDAADRRRAPSSA